MLRRITDLFLAEACSLSEEQIAVFDDIIERLADKVEVRFRRELAERLAIASNAPLNVTRKLAREEIEVARAILVNSMRLDDRDLAAIATEASQDHLLAISEREALSEQVTDVLVTRGDLAVMHSLAGNGGARFSGYGFKTLVDRAGDDEVLQERIGTRRDLPQPMLKCLLRLASERVRRRLIAKSQISGQADEFTRMIDALSASPPLRRTSFDYAVAEAVVDDMQRSGDLDEIGVLALIVSGREDHAISALARLAGLPPQTVEALWVPEQSEGLVILVKALGFNPNSARELVKRLMRSRATPEAVDEALKSFDRLSAATAQRVLRFWKVRATIAAGDGERVEPVVQLMGA